LLFLFIALFGLLQENELEEEQKPIVTYKGFDADWKCRDFQYAVGEVYEHAGKVAACSAGFHACEYPLDVFSYYPPAGSRFAVVEQSGALARHDSDSKVASSKIKISAEVNFAGLIKAAIEYTTSRCKPIDAMSPASATGDLGAASATGDRGAASATGDRGAASATGYQGAASATGDRGAASATGYLGAASATGKHSVAIACGFAGMAKACVGSAITVCFRDENYNLIHIRSSMVGQNGIEADVFYKLDKNGDFVKAGV
jgi:hypothetical protein